MREQTDMQKIKMVANLLLMLEIYQTEYSPMIVQHPFTSTGIVMNPHIGISEMLNIAQNESDLNMWREQMKKEIDAAQKPFEIYMMLNKPYCLTFLKYAMPHLSKEDFSVMLADAWIRSENPNMDRNLNKAALLDMFQQADPAELMEENERKELEEMDEVITIYRGVTSFNAKKIRSLSWTTEYILMERNDVKAASFTYSLNMLRLLLRMKLITQEEFEKTVKISAEYNGVKNIIFN